MKKKISAFFITVMVGMLFVTSAQAADKADGSTKNDAITVTSVSGDKITLPDGTQIKDAWVTEDGKTYYCGADGVLYKGLRNVSTENGSQTYYFGTDGAMSQSKWNTHGGKQYYSGSDGAIYKNRWDPTGKFYLGSSGQKATGIVTISGRKYYLNPSANGAKYTSGWLPGAKTYYAQSNGILYVNTTKVIGGYRYGFNSAGQKVTGIHTFSGDKYYFNSSGVGVNGWITIGSKKYYATNKGELTTEWKKIGKYYYYFYPSNCTMAKSKTIDGYKIDSKGRRGKASTYSKMLEKVRNKSSKTKYIIAVNCSAHKVAIFKGKKGKWKKAKYWDCGTGKAATPTKKGTFTVKSKGYYFDADGGARCFYYTQFSGNYLFHSVLYNKNKQLIDGRVGMALSHGCVRLKIKNAKWIYDNVPRGTKVIVY